MNRDDIVRMVWEAGIPLACVSEHGVIKWAAFEKFAKLVQLTTFTPAQIAHANAIERTLTDEVIADLWHANGGFHHHFARAVERYLKGEE